MTPPRAGRAIALLAFVACEAEPPIAIRAPSVSGAGAFVFVGQSSGRVLEAEATVPERVVRFSRPDGPFEIVALAFACDLRALELEPGRLLRRAKPRVLAPPAWVGKLEVDESGRVGEWEETPLPSAETLAELGVEVEAPKCLDLDLRTVHLPGEAPVRSAASLGDGRVLLGLDDEALVIFDGVSGTLASTTAVGRTLFRDRSGTIWGADRRGRFGTLEVHESSVRFHQRGLASVSDLWDPNVRLAASPDDPESDLMLFVSSPTNEGTVIFRLMQLSNGAFETVFSRAPPGDRAANWGALEWLGPERYLFTLPGSESLFELRGGVARLVELPLDEIDRVVGLAQLSGRVLAGTAQGAVYELNVPEFRELRPVELTSRVPYTTTFFELGGVVFMAGEDGTLSPLREGCEPIPIAAASQSRVEGAIWLDEQTLVVLVRALGAFSGLNPQVVVVRLNSASLCK